ncbi:MAG: SusC/RagA family TonB-linked outer membrane protein [Bacteroidota bacterium]
MTRLLCIILLSICTVSASFAQRTITGTVNDSDGEPLIGVNVLVKNTSIGTTTDFDGKFELEVPDAITSLLFSFIGYTTQEADIPSSGVVSVVLEEGVALDEIVVTALGISRDEKALSYSVQQVKSDDIVATQTRSPLEALKGKVAGVQIITASGAPGASTNVKLRGISSFTGNNEPLFVIDGVPVNNVSNNGGAQLTGAVDGGNAISDINPEDIESVNVLKGASAAALYGSRAANGVILITTKKGQSAQGLGKARIDFSQSVAFERVLLLPELQNQFGQGQNGDNQSFLNDQESWGDQFDRSLRPYGSIIGDPSSEFFNQQRFKAYEPLEDNIREFFDIGNTFTTNLSISGGNANSSLRVGGSYTDQTAIVANTGLTRGTVNLSGTHSFNERLSGAVSFNYIKQQNDLVVNGQGGEAPLNQVLQTSRDISLREQRDLTNIYNGIDWYYTPFIQNPYFNLFQDSYTKDMDRFYGSVNLSYDLLKQDGQTLTLNTIIGADIITDDRRRYKERRIASALSGNSGADEAGFIRDESYTDKQFDLNLTATYNRRINDDLGATLLVGGNFNQRSSKDFVASVIGTTLPEFSNFSNGTGTASVNILEAKRRLFGAFARLEFDYKNWLYLGGTFRQDWSSTLPASNRSFGYPSVYGSAVLSDLVDFSAVKINFLKIRASYAEVGNDAPVYLTNSIFTSPTIAGVPIQGNFAQTGFPFNGVGGFTQGDRIGNPNLQPERTKEIEFGIDLRLLKSRVGIDATYFNRRSVDQIIRNAQTAPTSGYRFQVINAGEMVNQGFELVLDLVPIKTSDFEWSITTNFTKIDNEVVSLLTPENDAEQLGIGFGLANYTFNAIEGQPYGIIQAPTALRDPNGNLIVDGNGLPQQAPNPAFFGTVQPDWFGGIRTSISWKGFRASALVERSEGGVVYSRTVGQIYFNGSAAETAFNNRERFIVPFSVVDNGDGTFAPNTTAVDYASNNIRTYWNSINTFGEYLVVDASFTKLREVTFSYTLPNKLLAKLPFENVTIGLFGRNLWIHTPDDNTYIDPEVNSFTAGNGNIGNLQGFEFGTLPSTSTYGANLRLSF